MTVTYDPSHSAYVDEADTRGELTRVFDVCNECRRCVCLCSVFPSLFDMIGQHADQDAGRLTPEQQDRTVDQCFHCKLCAVDCPYTPDRHALQINLPRLILRAQAMRFTHGHHEASRTSTRVLASTSMVGAVGAAFSSVANRWIGAPSGSFRRRMLTRLTGVSSVRRLPEFAAQRFSSWLRHRGDPPVRTDASTQRPVAVFATCVVEFQLPAIGRDVVRVYERNGIPCVATQAGCCGAAWLDAGNVKTFTRVAATNVELLANEVRDGCAIVVPDPMCTHVLRNDYPLYVRSPDAELVAANTFDACEYLMTLNGNDGEFELDTDFVGPVPVRVISYSGSQLRGDVAGERAAELLRLTGAAVHTAGETVGDTGWWGVRAGREAEVRRIAQRLVDSVVAADHTGEAMVVSDSAFASIAVAELTGVLPLHPLQLLARAYGMAEE